jgi:hypothetical protein
MCSTCCALGVIGKNCEHQFLVATDVVSKPCGRLGGEIKIILKWIWEEWIRNSFWWLTMAPVQYGEFWTDFGPLSFQESGCFLLPRNWMQIIIWLKFAVREKAGLIRSFKELINIIGTVLNNKTCSSIPLTALQPAVNLWLPILSASNLFHSARPISSCYNGEVSRVFIHAFLTYLLHGAESFLRS